MTDLFNSKNSISLIWCVDDVKNQLNDLKESDWFEKEYGKNVKLTHDECMDILSAVQSEHDASTGVSWDTIKDNIYKHLDIVKINNK